MNIYSNESISLSKESAEKFVNNILLDMEPLSLRDDFISEIEDNIIFLENGNIIVEVPDVELVDSDIYRSVKVAVNTREINIKVNDAMTVNSCYCYTNMQDYNRTVSGNMCSKYNASIKTNNNKWNTITEDLYHVA